MKLQRTAKIYSLLLLLLGVMLLISPQATQAQRAKNQKLDSALVRLSWAAGVSAAANSLAERQGLRLSGNRVQVQVVTGAAQASAARQAIADAGGEVTGSGFDQTVLQAWLPIPALTQVAAASAVHFIRRPIQAYPLERLAVGQSTTEALNAINASAWHSTGYQGAGVKIAIIDAGFLGYGSLLGSDLPPNVTVKNFVDGETEAQTDGTTEHGTACAEIIHDLAPQAEIYLVKIATDVDLAEAVAWLIDEGVDIISSSFGFYNAAPGDGTGPIADLVTEAQTAGILWVTAAGNDREAHWGGLFSDADGDGRHEFVEGQEINCFVTPSLSGTECSEFGFILVSLVGQLNIFVRWSDWEAVDQDYDLHLVRQNGGGWEIVPGFSSTNPQNGGPGQTPTEWISYNPAADDFNNLLKPHGILIERVQGNRPVNFELFVPQFGGLLRPQKILTARSLANLADSPAAITVAALDVNAPYPQELYSSEGPTNGPGGVAEGAMALS